MSFFNRLAPNEKLKQSIMSAKNIVTLNSVLFDKDNMKYYLKELVNDYSPSNDVVGEISFAIISRVKLNIYKELNELILGAQPDRVVVVISRILRDTVLGTHVDMIVLHTLAKVSSMLVAYRRSKKSDDYQVNISEEAIVFMVNKTVVESYIHILDLFIMDNSKITNRTFLPLSSMLASYELLKVNGSGEIISNGIKSKSSTDIDFDKVDIDDLDVKETESEEDKFDNIIVELKKEYGSRLEAIIGKNSVFNNLILEYDSYKDYESVEDALRKEFNDLIRSIPENISLLINILAHISNPSNNFINEVNRQVRVEALSVIQDISSIETLIHTPNYSSLLKYDLRFDRLINATFVDKTAELNSDQIGILFLLQESINPTTKSLREEILNLWLLKYNGIR